ncbi:HD domain containing protein [Aphelenchoides avenae]|nr:HD domain containing protein [Aphelenchus avenae]
MIETVCGDNTLPSIGAAGSRVHWARVYDKRHHYREISDAVHGPIPIFPPLNLIIDTPEFQRLRRLKQLNACSLVFPCAEHTRFTHSLGVYHLANSALQQLVERQPELQITGADQLCVCIAALVHDLGHGPFSHLYDGFFVKEVNPKSEWRHERGSVLIFRLILDRYEEVRTEFYRYLDHEDLVFIEELIDPPKKFICDGEWQLKGRPPEKAFLYDLVSNVHSGTDVDKFDYFLRDSMLAPLSIGFDIRTVQRIFSHTRAVHDADLGYWRLAYDQKIVPDLRLVAEARIRLHLTVYQHKTAVAADIL